MAAIEPAAGIILVRDDLEPGGSVKSLSKICLRGASPRLARVTRQLTQLGCRFGVV